MSPFRDVLNDLNRRLDLPQPIRGRILLEIAGDLDELYRHFLEQGREPEGARRETLARLDLSPQALQEMAGIHTGGLRRLLASLGSQRLSRLERAVFLLVLVVVGLYTGRLLLEGRLFLAAGPLVWPVAVGTAFGLLLAGVKFYQLGLKQDHRPAAVQRGLNLLLGLAVGDLVLGLAGFWFGLRQAALQTVEEPGLYLLHLVSWLHGGAALLIVAFLGAVLVALLWFIISSRVARIEEAEVAYLLEG
jgi:hypothetical protein